MNHSFEQSLFTITPSAGLGQANALANRQKMTQPVFAQNTSMATQSLNNSRFGQLKMLASGCQPLVPKMATSNAVPTRNTNYFQMSANISGSFPKFSNPSSFRDTHTPPLPNYRGATQNSFSNQIKQQNVTMQGSSNFQNQSLSQIPKFNAPSNFRETFTDRAKNVKMVSNLKADTKQIKNQPAVEDHGDYQIIRDVVNVNDNLYHASTVLDLELKQGPEQLMGPAHDLKKMSEFPYILTEGGDDRLPLDPKTGTNKYHQKPFVAPEALFRGSCTCNSPTQGAFDSAQLYYEMLKQGETNYEDMMHATRMKLKELYQLPDGTGIFLMPSGSDAEYIPLLIAQLLNEGKDITNIVTCNEEVGSGTLEAAGGKFFSPIEPIPGYTLHMKGGAKNKDPLLELGENVKTVAIGARTDLKDTREFPGSVIDPHDAIQETLNECKETGRVPIVHSVFGSKTGIKQEFQPKLKQQAEDMGGLYVVDACQGRFNIEWINWHMKKDITVLITGSKFFRGPPFSGGVIVPAGIMKKLQALGDKTKVPYGLNTFMGKADIPRELQTWRDQIEDNQNPGLALRWVAALTEMEATLTIDDEVQMNATDTWRQEVINMVGEHENLNYFSEAKDTASIVSVRIKHPETGAWMNKDELAKVFKAMTLDMSNSFPSPTFMSSDSAYYKELASKICFTGQPVKINDEQAVLRIALGSDSLRQVISDMQEGDIKNGGALEADKLICEKMAFLGNHFELL